MPQDRYSSQDAFNIDLLDSQALDTPDGLPAALRAIEEACYRGDPEIATMVVALSSRSHILEYIITGMSCAHKFLRVPIILLSSTGGRGIRKAVEVDSYRVPHIRNAQHDGYCKHAAPPKTLIFVAVRRVSIRCRCAP